MTHLAPARPAEVREHALPAPGRAERLARADGAVAGGLVAVALASSSGLAYSCSRDYHRDCSLKP